MADSETGWTKGIPAKSGWYFMCTEGEDVITDGMVVWVGHNQSGVRHEGNFIYANSPWLSRREFHGPILLADIEQLTRLRAAAEKALACLVMSRKGFTQWAEADNAITALREALAQQEKGEKS